MYRTFTLALLGGVWLTASAAWAQTTCEPNQLNDCVNTALELSQTDAAAAAAINHTACDLGNARGCNNLAVLHIDGSGVAQDDALAFQYYERACNQGLLVSCVNLGQLYREGQGVEADAGRANALFEMTCDRSNGLGCWNLAVSEGTDPATAVSLLRDACRMGETAACVLAGTYLREGAEGLAPDVSLAEFLYELACFHENAEGCLNLGWLYETDAFGLQDLTLATEVYEYGCNLEALTCCTNSANLLAHAGEDARALVLFEHACSGGEWLGCANLFVLEVEGRATASDFEAALSVLLGTCLEGTGGPEACTWAGIAFEQGLGVPADPVRALELVTMGCQQGDERGCGVLYGLAEQAQQAEQAP